MLKMNRKTPEQDQTSQPSSDNADPAEPFRPESRQAQSSAPSGILQVVTSLLRSKPDPSSLRETIEEYLEEGEENDKDISSSDFAHERQLLSNILKLRDLTAFDVMVPRADIVAINADASYEDLLGILAEKTYSRLPVYKNSLDVVIGSVHVKDVLSTLAKGETVKIRELVRDIPIISPSLKVLDLLLQMRITGKHMALVVDEYGGTDGLVTIGDVIEAVVGEIDDEHDPDEEPEVHIRNDGTIMADARLDLNSFEKRFNISLNEEEKEESETLGGLISSIAGRVPVRGEVIPHKSGVIFEILDADPRRVNRVCIRNLEPSSPDQIKSD